MLLYYRPNWISVHGEKFFRSEFVITGFQSDDLPLFGKVEDILVVSSTIPLLAVKMYRTEGIHMHIDGYQIFPTNETTIILLSILTHKLSFCSHTFIGDKFSYIVFQSNIFNPS